jgi:hypothetical protein
MHLMISHIVSHILNKRSEIRSVLGIDEETEMRYSTSLSPQMSRVSNREEGLVAALLLLLLLASERVVARRTGLLGHEPLASGRATETIHIISSLL